MKAVVRDALVLHNVMNGTDISNQVESQLRTSASSTFTDIEHVKGVWKVIGANHCLTVCKVTAEPKIIEVCHTILTEKLQMKRVVAQFVPRLLAS